MEPRRSLTGRVALVCALVAGVVMCAVVLGGCASIAGAGSRTRSAAGAAPATHRFSVDLSSGKYVPSEISAAAGTPISITFGQAQGCVRTLVFPKFSIKADMTQGAKTFDLGVLQPGDYTWSCGMNMQHGVLHVK
jgi:Cu+-exporting ATPase